MKRNILAIICGFIIWYIITFILNMITGLIELYPINWILSYISMIISSIFVGLIVGYIAKSKEITISLITQLIVIITLQISFKFISEKVIDERNFKSIGTSIILMIPFLIASGCGGKLGIIFKSKKGINHKQTI